MYKSEFIPLTTSSPEKKLKGPELQMKDLKERMNAVNMIDDIAVACQLDCPNYFHCNSKPVLENLNWQAYARDTFINVLFSLFTKQDYLAQNARYQLNIHGFKAGTSMCAITNSEVPLKHKEIRSVYFKEHRNNSEEVIEI